MTLGHNIIAAEHDANKELARMADDREKALAADAQALPEMMY
jgi:hypothetical protein